MQEEKNYLQKVLQCIESNISKMENKIEELDSSIFSLKTYVNDDFYGMDEEEAVQNNAIVDDSETMKDVCAVLKAKLLRQKKHPYFGRFDFKEDDETVLLHPGQINKSEKFYLGLSHLQSESGPLVYDWRAPISSMYYDYGVGRASYICPDGEIGGEISLKRQYKITEGKLEYVVDTNDTISDDILTLALSQTSSDKMKEIVSTIQKEQNKIIREDVYRTLLVQGVAGSGKTSVALHRAAYLLYRHRNEIKSDEILILSPSHAFSSYISDVLPELGEANIMQMTFEGLCKDELEIKFESRDEMTKRLCENPEGLDEIAFKSSFDFLKNLEIYVNDTLMKSFNGMNINLAGTKLSKDMVEAMYYDKFAGQNIYKRINNIADYVLDRVKIKDEEDLPKVRERILNILRKGFPTISIPKIYSYYLAAIGMNLKLKGDKFYYEDQAPLLYLKLQLLGLKFNEKIKYFIIDEMQDYTPVHFAIFKTMFECSKLIVGDINQCIEKTLDDNYLEEVKKFFDADLIKLNKSYRQTSELSQYASKLLKVSYENFSRHGKVPKIIQLSKDTLKDQIINQLLKYDKYNSVAIITKTEEEAVSLSALLGGVAELILSRQPLTENKVKIIPAALSKGLEFDAVIVFDANNKNFSSEFDKRLLYVILTRPLHEVAIMHEGQLTPLLCE